MFVSFLELFGIVFAVICQGRYHQLAIDDDCFETLAKVKAEFGGTTSDVLMAALINLRHAAAVRQGKEKG